MSKNYSAFWRDLPEQLTPGRAIVFKRIVNLFKPHVAPTGAAIGQRVLDADMGELKFFHGIGWTGLANVDGEQVEIAFYSRGELPSESQKASVGYWLKNWTLRREELNAFMETESKRWRKGELPSDWLAHGIPPIATLQLSGIVQLDPVHRGNVSIYLVSPADEYRQFTIAAELQRPMSFGFDDA